MATVRRKLSVDRPKPFELPTIANAGIEAPRPPMTPERALAFRCLTEALHEAGRDTKIGAEARAWILSRHSRPSSDGRFSFLQLCEEFGLDASSIRSVLLSRFPKGEPLMHSRALDKSRARKTRVVVAA